MGRSVGICHRLNAGTQGCTRLCPELTWVSKYQAYACVTLEHCTTLWLYTNKASQHRIMKLSRPSRFVAALVALVSVLFTQLAVAAYACPSMQVGQAMEMALMAAAEPDHHMMPDCAAMDVEQPALCHAHAQVGDQSLDKPNLPDVSSSVAILLVPEIGDIHVAYRPVHAYADASSRMRALAPPLSILNCCFRI